MKEKRTKLNTGILKGAEVGETCSTAAALG